MSKDQNTMEVDGKSSESKKESENPLNNSFAVNVPQQQQQPFRLPLTPQLLNLSQVLLSWLVINKFLTLNSLNLHLRTKEKEFLIYTV